MSVQQIEETLLELPARQRLRIARALLDSVLTVDIDTEELDTAHLSNPLLKIVGVFSGGPGNTAERVNEIVAEEIDKKHLSLTQ